MCYMNTETKEQIKNQLANYVERIGSMNAASKKLQSVSIGTISNILADKWENISEAMWLSVQKQTAPSIDGWEILQDTTRFKAANHFYNEAKEYSEVHCLLAEEGTGKTAPAKLFSEKENVFLVTCAAHFNRRSFLMEQLKALGVNYTKLNTYDMLNKLIETVLKLKNPVFVWDEVNKLQDPVLLFFISIFNVTEGKLGIILQAPSHFQTRIENGIKKGIPGYAEIYSRFGRKFIDLPNDTTEDLANIIRLNGINDQFEINRIINESDYDKRRVKKLVKAYFRKERRAA